MTIPADGVHLEGTLILPPKSLAIVAVLHDTAIGRDHPRHQFVADILRSTGIGTLALDLLSRAEERSTTRSGSPRLAQERITERTAAAVDWLGDTHPARDIPVGLLGHGPAATTALKAAAMRPDRVAAVVSSEARPDPAEPSLSESTAAILLVVGGENEEAIRRSRQVAVRLVRARARKLQVVPGASDLFEFPGALEHLGVVARHWFRDHLGWLEETPWSFPVDRLLSR